MNYEKAIKCIDEMRAVSDGYRRDLKRVVTALCEEEKDEEVIAYSIGQTFQGSSGDKYMLVSIGVRQIQMINLKTGNRYSDPVKVNNQSEITFKEMEQITSYKFLSNFTLLD